MAVIDTQVNQVDFRSAIPRKIPAGFPDAGKIAIVGFETRWLADSLLNGPASSYTWPYPAAKASATSHIFVSTDETAVNWEWRGYLPHATPGRNDAVESPIVFLPNGDWMTASYARETHDFISWYSAALYRSTDQGYTWTHDGFVGPRANPAGNQDTTYLADEPFLLMLTNGEMLCMIRTLEEGRPASAVTGLTHHLWRCTNPTVRGATTWVDEGVKTPTWAGSRAPIYQHSNGVIIHHYRIVNNGGSGPGAYMLSEDLGHTWNTSRFLDTGATSFNTSGPPVYSYGDIVELSNGYVGMVYCDETPPPGSPSAQPANRWATIGVPSTSAPSTPLTITPTSVWSLSGTTLTVTSAPSGTRSVASGTAGSAGGGLVRFIGTHADRFSVSLDGTTFTPTVTIPSGYTPIYLGVTPQAGDTTLSAQVGIPV